MDMLLLLYIYLFVLAVVWIGNIDVLESTDIVAALFVAILWPVYLPSLVIRRLRQK